MDISRRVDQGGITVALERLQFVLDQFESADKFSKSLTFDTKIVPDCTLEEILGALVASEQALRRIEEL